MQTIPTIFHQQKQNLQALRDQTAAERIAKLERLKSTLLARTEDLQTALFKDFRKSPTEVSIMEIYPTIVEIDTILRNLKKWMKPVSVKRPWLMFGSKSEIHYEPKGMVLCIGPWNYPAALILTPLVSAIAAGNAVILKPSELTPHTSHFLKNLIEACFQPNEVALFEGGSEVATALLELPFDHIFFTGSGRVGQVVMQAAAKHLTSITLELGGKSPAIIDSSANLAQAAQRICWGKFLNAGQTCVAPDYVLIHEDLALEWIHCAKNAIAQLYGASEQAREKSPDLCRIIHPAAFQRLEKLTQETVKAGAKLELGGVFKADERYISPTLLSGVTFQHPIMQEEIFGPILPVITYRSLEEAYANMREQPKPLALYVFGKNQDRINSILHHTDAGGSCVNNTLLHLANPHLPFGGAGPSGLGAYHGHFGFKTFSHARAVHRQGCLNSTQMLYPPYGAKHRALIKATIRWLTG